MAFREFRFHRGGGSIEYDHDPVRGITYGDPRTSGAVHRTTSPSITRLVDRGEWCHQCDLELPEPIHSRTIEASVLRAVREGKMNLSPLSWTVIAGRLGEERCPACGSHMSRKMIDSQRLPDIPLESFDPGPGFD